MTSKKEQALLVINELIGHVERLRSDIPYEFHRVVTMQDNLEGLREIVSTMEECKCEV
jgi:hypothetical protein